MVSEEDLVVSAVSCNLIIGGIMAGLLVEINPKHKSKSLLLLMWIPIKRKKQKSTIKKRKKWYEDDSS